jgi:hypothetical protein
MIIALEVLSITTCASRHRGFVAGEPVYGDTRSRERAPVTHRNLTDSAVGCARRARHASGSRRPVQSEIEPPTIVSETSLHPETLSAATTSIEWIRDFAQRPLQGWSSHKVERVLALMTEDVEYRVHRLHAAATPT